jgi:small subunit ribosomal protein S4
MRRIRKKYKRPRHPWQRLRIEEEKALRKEYGYKSKREIWKMRSILRNLRAHARRLIGESGKQAEVEKAQLLQRLNRLGLLPRKASVEDVLGLTIKDLLERRLQTLVYKRGLANTIRQSRQLITHGHVLVAGVKITSPSYLVPKDEEGKIQVLKGEKGARG